MNRSTFTLAKGYMLDNFIELSELPPSMIMEAERLAVLRATPNKTEVENQEMASLMIRLQNYIISTETWNKLCDAIINMELYIKENVFDHVDAMKLETKTYVDNKKIEFQAEIDKLKDFGDYNPLTKYFKNNLIHYQHNTEKHCYMCKGNIVDGIDNGVVGINPTDTTKWLQLTIKGDKGERGVDGVGLISKGVWSGAINYNENQMVYYKGYTFASLKSNNIGHEPVPNMDTEWWSMVFKNTVVTTKLEGTISLTANTKNVRFMGLGNISAFNPSTDSLSVKLNTVPLISGTHYQLNLDNESIGCLIGDFIASVDDPAIFTFEIIRNQINDLLFGDGSAIALNSIPRNRLDLETQQQLDKIDILSTDIGDKTLINTGFKDNLVGAINEINDKVTDYIYDVVTSDADGKPTKTTYKRSSDNTLYKEVTCSNADTNGYYRTVVEKTYGTDGITLQSTKTYTFTYNADGYVLTKRWVTV